MPSKPMQPLLQGAHGHLGMVVTPTVYASIPNTVPYTIPAFPGPQQVYPATSTQQQRAEINNTYKRDLHNFTECTNLQQALRKQLINALDPMYLEPLRDRNTGFAHIPLRDMLTHLFTNYGQITRKDLQDNMKTLSEPYDVNTPMETLFNTYKDCQDYAEAGEHPLNEQQIIDAAYTAIYDTGYYFDDCDDWDALPSAQQTWTRFQTHFLEAQRKQRLKQRTTQNTGFHAANAALQEQLASLATNAEVDRQTAAAAQAEQRQVLQALTENIAALNKALKEKDSLIEKLSANAPGGTRTTGKKPVDNGSYCWTHGFCTAKDHTSGTCKKSQARSPKGSDQGQHHGRQHALPTTLQMTTWTHCE